MRAFKEMKHFVANNNLMLERIKNVEFKQLEYQKKSDEKFEKIFQYLANDEKSNQKFFLFI